MGILNFLFIKSKAVERLDKNTIYKKYYADYPEKPYISNERNIPRMVGTCRNVSKPIFSFEEYDDSL